MTSFKSKKYEDIKEEVKKYLENPPMIALPGGSWCHLCSTELCRNPVSHRNSQMLLIVINKLMLDLAEERTKERFVVREVGSCKQVFIPKGYCTVYLQNQKKDDVQMGTVGDDICIQNLSADLPCQKLSKKMGFK